MSKLNLKLTLILVAAFALVAAIPGSTATASSLTRIHFATGTTSAVVSGDLAANSRTEYVLRAFAGQLMDVSLSAPEGVKLSVMTRSGRSLAALTSSSTSFRGYLPRSGDYILAVSSGSASISYSVNVSIPERVAFQRGTTSATVKRDLKASQSHDYILRAQAGQLMEINVTPENSLQLIIYGVDGTVLRSGMGEGSSFRGVLPLSEDYIVTVRSGSQAVTYSMNVIIPVRIKFQTGADSASLRGSLATHRSQYYVLSALKDQTMQVEITPISGVQLIIYGADGTVLTGNPPSGASFTGKLPSSQDYVLEVRSTASSTVLYRFKVTIR